MKRFLKFLFYPLVLIRRVILHYWYSPRKVSQRLFKYDCGRFAGYAGCFNAEPRAASLARIIMAYHVLEKGITMPRRHLDFGHAAVLNLIGLIEDFEKRFGVEDPQVNHAVGCVKEYFDLHRAVAFDMSTDVDYWNTVKSFCASHDMIAPSEQIETTRDAFFANNEASFPVFAASRHTSRHYEGVVQVERIKAAVKLAMTAPSACNRQFIKVYCVSNHEMRDKLFSLQNGNRGFGSDADKVLVVTADLRGNRWAEERNDLYTNAGIFIMNLCYALHYNKIAHCILNWSVSPENDVAGHELLGIPENELMTMIISCGNAPARFALASSPRKELTDVFTEVS